jgi:5'-3' exonuclease
VACDWLLVDGSSLIFRSYYGALRSGTNAGRRDVNAVGPFLERLARLIVQRRARQVAVADDEAWRPDWRVERIPTYKSHRMAEPIPPALAPQVPIIQAILAAIGIDMVGVPEYEAEDVIATWCALAPGTIEISSGDRDLFALVEDPRVRVLYPEKAGLAVIDESEVTRRYDIPGRRYADFAILRGDPSDGLPGLRGVGAVTAAGMIRRHGDIAGVLRERELSEADRAYLENAMRVVPPVADVPVELPRGRRDAYPDDEDALRALAAEFRVGNACARLLEVVARLPTRASTE